MKNYIYLCISILVCCSCKQQAEIKDQEQSYFLSDTSREGSTPLLGKDHQGNPFSWWMEKEPQSGKKIVAFSISKDHGASFEKPITIPITSGCNDGHGQGMPRLVFKRDGTMLIVYHMKEATEDNPYAGKILYSHSYDKGKTWESPRILHQDTVRNNSHGYPAIALLPDGEVAAAWLDGRNKLPYSELFLSVTEGKKGFVKETRIGGPTCQCCKLDMYTDSDQNVHLLYRGIIEDNIRDIMHIVSTDSGKTFSEPSRISNDGWKIKGCPHAGPGMVLNGDSLHYAWFTMGGGEGIFYCSSDKKGTAYSPRRNLAKGIAKYPQITSLENTHLAIAWQEFDTTSLKGQSYSRVKVQLRGRETKDLFVTKAGTTSAHPALLSLNDHMLLIAYEELVNNKTVIAYRTMHVE